MEDILFRKYVNIRDTKERGVWSPRCTHLSAQIQTQAKLRFVFDQCFTDSDLLQMGYFGVDRPNMRGRHVINDVGSAYVDKV